MTLKNTWKELWVLAWPIALSGLVTILISGNDAVLLAGSSDRVLASVVASSSVHSVAMLVVAGLVSPTQVLIARAVGAGREDLAARNADAGLAVGLWSGVAAAILLALLGPHILNWLSGAAIDSDFAASYLMITLCALPLSGLSSALRARLTGYGRTRGLLIASISAVIVDVGAAIVLNQLIGPHGVAIATVAGALTTVVVLDILITRDSSADLRPLRLTSIVATPLSAAKEVLAIGWPEAILFGASAGAGVVVTWLLSISAPAELASSRFLELATSMASFTVMSSVGAAASTLLGRRAGAGDGAGFRAVLKHTVALTLFIAVAIFALGSFTFAPLVSLAASDDVVQSTQSVALLAFAQMFPMAAHVAAVAGLRSLKDTRSPMYSSLISEYLVFLPLGWYLTRSVGMGLQGVFIDHLVFWAVAVVICVVRLVPLMRREFEPAAAQTGQSAHEREAS